MTRFVKQIVSFVERIFFFTLTYSRWRNIEYPEEKVVQLFVLFTKWIKVFKKSERVNVYNVYNRRKNPCIMNKEN